MHFVLVLLGSMILTGVVRYYALAHKVLDIPNQRSSHNIPIPRGGGLAIVLAFSLAMLTLFLNGWINQFDLLALSSTLLVAGIGFCDDHTPVATRWRLLTHILAALMALFCLHDLPMLLVPTPIDWVFNRWIINPGWLWYPFGTLFLVWLLNLFNFMDGTDGIAASESLFVSLALAGYVFYLDRGLLAVTLSLAAASLGFLQWNWPKARVFMGDVGSGFLGLLLGILILMAARQAAVLLYCGLILFGIFTVDATYTLLYRFFSGQKWFEAHCSHTYQHAAKQYGHLKVLLACWTINCCWLLPLSWLVFLYPAYALFGLFLAYLPLFYLAYRFKAGRATI